MPPMLADIETYLDGVGLKQHRNINQFWAYLDSRYAKNQVGDLERAYIKLEQGDEESFYTEIFQNLKTSLDFSSLRRDLYRAYLNWFVKAVTAPPAVLLDAGCGNGILTCFYAQQFRDARVIGFDISEPGITCAKELAQQLNLLNVEFHVADASDPELPLEAGKADLVTSVATLGPGARKPGDCSAYSLFEKPKINKSLLAINALAKYLKEDGGTLISFDKVSDLSSQIRWASMIQSAQLGIDLERSTWLSYQNIEADTVTLPALVATTKCAPASHHDLISFFISNSIDLSSFTLDFGQEGMAELVFTFINPRKFLRGARANYSDGSGTYWYELWQAGPFIITFEHTDQGFRTLRVAPSVMAKELLASVDEWIEQTSSYADVVEIEKPEIEFSSVM